LKFDIVCCDLLTHPLQCPYPFARKPHH
jgi:hypothetical protein